MVKEIKGDFKKGRWINDILDLVNNFPVEPKKDCDWPF
jgi:hypothetical protein